MLTIVENNKIFLFFFYQGNSEDISFTGSWASKKTF